MKEKYVKIEWMFQDDSVPRLVGIPDDERVSIDKDFLKSIEAKTNNKILKAYPYDPKPQILIVAVGYLVGSRSYPAPSLIVALRPIFDPVEFETLGILKSLGCHNKNEIIYEAVRTSWVGYWKESDNTLFFEEYGVNPEQELISVLELLMNILSTAQMHLDSEPFAFDQTQMSAN
jgi:hypothetical protein